MTSPLVNLRRQYHQTRHDMAMLLGYSAVQYKDREDGIRKLLPSGGQVLSEVFGIDAAEIIREQDRYVSEVLAGLRERFENGVRR